MLFLQAEDPEKDIQLYINSPAARSRGIRDLRHDAVREAGRGDNLCRPGGVYCGGLAGGRRAEKALCAAKCAHF